MKTNNRSNGWILYLSRFKNTSSYKLVEYYQAAMSRLNTTERQTQQCSSPNISSFLDKIREILQYCNDSYAQFQLAPSSIFLTSFNPCGLYTKGYRLVKVVEKIFLCRLSRLWLFWSGFIATTESSSFDSLKIWIWETRNMFLFELLHNKWRILLAFASHLLKTP